MEIREGFIEREKIRKKLHKGVVVFMMMMVMVVGFAYKIGKSEREDTQGERGRERLVDGSSRKRFGERPY